MTARAPLPPPRRMTSDPGALGDLMRAAQRYSPPLDQRAAFAKLLAEAQGQRRPLWSVPAWAAGFAAGCVLLALAFGWHRTRSELEHRPAPLARTAAPVVPAPPASQPKEPVARPGRWALPSGESRLDDGSRVRLAGASAARVESGPSGVRVGLEHGSINVEVAHQTEGRSFEVSAKAYRFVALGTAFTVSASGDDVRLEVSEGRVAVLRGDAELARVGAGESWPPADAERDADATPAAPSSRAVQRDEPNCLDLMTHGGRERDAERCFTAQAAAGGLGAEMALFELARLRSDVLGDPSGALSALHEYRRRFPTGSLRTEVDISLIHLLARLGRHAELIAESDKLLQTLAAHERGAELRMLRAHAFRTGLKDFRNAEREYAAVERSGSRFAADAAFHRGACLEALGDRDGAAAAYRRYLERPGRSRAAEARRRLSALETP